MLTLFTHKKSLLRCRRDQKEGLLSCNIFHGKFILGTGEISDRVFNYLVDASKNSFYTLSDEMSEFFEKNHYFKKSDFDIQDFSVEIFRYFINEGVIVIHEDN